MEFDDSWTYDDELLVEIASTEDQLTRDDDELVWVETFGVSLPPGWLEQAVLGSLGDAGVTDTFHIDLRRRVTEWGASVAAEQVLILLVQGVFVDAALRVAEHFGRRLVGQLRRGPTAGLLGEEEAVAWARNRVAIRYGVEYADLQPVSVRTDSDNVEVDLADPQGVRYAVRMRGVGAGVHLVECTRTWPLT